MKEQVITLEKAQEEVQKWLDYKRLDVYFLEEANEGEHKTTEGTEDEIRAAQDMVKQFIRGTLSLNEDFSITHKLMFPISENVKEISYAPRVAVAKIQAKMRGVKKDDMMGFSIAQIAAITNENTSILRNLDSIDMRVAQTICSFF